MASSNSPSVLFISKYFPPSYSGYGKFIFRLATKLAESGYSVTVLCNREEGNKVFLSNIRVIRLPKIGNRKKIRNITFAIQASFAILFMNLNFDIVFTRANIYLLPLLIWLKKRGKKLVLRTSMFGSDDGFSLNKSKNGQILLKYLHTWDAIICQTDLFFNSFKEIGIDETKLKIIPVAVDTNIYKPVNPGQQLRLKNKIDIQGSPLVLCVGGIIRRKGIDLLAVAWENVLEKWPDAKLLLVGPIHNDNEKNRKYYQEICEIFESYSGIKSVNFTGGVIDPSPYFRACDLFVFPSRQEGSPNALIEAMACQKPIVTTSFMGYTPYIGENDKDFIVVEPDDAAKLTDSICLLLENNNLKCALAESAYKRAKEIFSFDIVLQQYKDLFERITKEE